MEFIAKITVIRDRNLDFTQDGGSFCRGRSAGEVPSDLRSSARVALEALNLFGGSSGREGPVSRPCLLGR